MVKAFIPRRGKKYVIKDMFFGGMNRCASPDSKEFTDVCGADLSLLPAVCASDGWRLFYSFSGDEYPLSMCAVGNRLIAFCRKLVPLGDGFTQVDALNTVAVSPEGQAFIGDDIYYRTETGTFLISDYNFPRSMVQFCVYHDGGALHDALGGKYDKKILIFPDKLSMDYDVDSDFTLSKLEDDGVVMPDLKYVTVHAARLFGVDDNRIYASAYNDYKDWDVDVASDISADNAWASNTGADSRADGDFTAITTYAGKVIAMKRDFCHQVYNNKNPFRVYDVARSGAIDSRSVCEVRGNLFYVSADGVMRFTGAEPVKISAPLGIDRFEDGICGSHGDSLYVYEKGKIYVYNTVNGTWSSISVPETGEVVNFAELNGVLYVLTHKNQSENYIYALDGEPNEWYVECSAKTFGVYSDKRVSRINVLCDIGERASVKVYLAPANGDYSETPVIDSGGRQGRTALKALIRASSSPAHRMKIVCSGDVTLYGIQTYAYKEDDGGE